jgi:hypothetical protein
MAETRKFDGEIPREAFSIKSGGGNSRARRMLVEGAWTYRLPVRMGAESLKRDEVLPQAIKQIAWKAKARLCARFRRLAKVVSLSI